MRSEIKETMEIVIKKFGHINLKKILASLVLTSLLIPGAINRDWKIVIPIIMPALISGKILIMFTTLVNDFVNWYVLKQ